MSLISVVTGANSGIGRATAIHLAQHGHIVYGTVRDVERAGKLASMAADAGVEVKLVELDVADDASVREASPGSSTRPAGVDVLVNNAGVGGNAVVEECPPSTVPRRHERQPLRRRPVCRRPCSPACASEERERS